MTKKPEAAIALAFKADSALRERIKAHLDWMHQQTPGVTFSQSDALRNLLVVGLDASEEDRNAANKKGAKRK